MDARSPYLRMCNTSIIDVDERLIFTDACTELSFGRILRVVDVVDTLNISSVQDTLFPPDKKEDEDEDGKVGMVLPIDILELLPTLALAAVW